MPDNRTGATARVTFTVEMPARSSWGDTCQVDQIYRQAGGETKAALEQILKAHGGRIIGEPKVVAVLAERN